MSDRELFASTISELGTNSFLGMSECEKFGMTWGCREDCPVLQEGLCENYQSVEDFIKQNS